MKKIDKIIATLLTFIGLPGQILARAVYKNGSLNKSFLLLFALPPFSIIPAIAMWFGYIKDAHIKDKPFDLYLLIGMFLITLIPFMLHLKIDNKILVNILVQIALIGIIHYVYNEKFNRVCSTKYRRIDASITHALILAPVSLLLARLIMIFLNNILNKYNIDVKKTFDLNKYISNNYTDKNDLIGLYFFVSISLAIVYILLNMFYSSEKKNNLACNNKIKIHHLVILIIINILVSFIIKPKLLN